MFPRSVATHGFLNSPKAIASIRGRLIRLVASGTLLTYFDLIQEVRAMVGDPDVAGCPIRYTDTIMINALNRGLQELGRIRPDAWYDTFDSNDLNVYEITDQLPGPGQTLWTELFGIEVRFWPALVYYVIGQMDIIEDDFVSGGARYPHRYKAAAANRIFRRQVLHI